ncbi:MAG: DUF3800 domain-containing protein [Candidatus Thermoplasmatota archaeon]|nr:DUF3800 domain-containing protein [Candidatus Thermoplasmatota archaeon]
MATYSDAIYIDESGSGSPTDNIHRYWVSAAVSVAFDQTIDLDEGIRRILTSHFSPYIGELKGSSMSKYLHPTSTILEIVKDLGDVLDRTGAQLWGAAASFGSSPPRGLPTSNPKPKDIARQMLLEEINARLLTGYHHPDHSLIIWDISERQELQDFSASIARFMSVRDETPRSERLVPAALGGLSHDWRGLQTADVIANCALHYLGHTASLTGSKTDKAEAFRTEFLPRMQKIESEDIIGWMVRQHHKKK